MLHALGVLVWAEDVDSLVVGRAVGFHALVALLTVVEARCHAMDAEKRRGDECGSRPFAGLDGVV